MSKDNHFKAVLAYNGASYSGFQLQKQGEKTIQGEIYNALDRMGFNEFSLIPSGRTDSGVHALNQVIKLSLSKEFAEEKLCHSLNSILPKDIFIKSLEKCDAAFSPRTNAIKKTYSYVIYNSTNKPVFHNDLVTHIPYSLDWELISKGMQKFIGAHDFKNFFTVGTPVSSTVRDVSSFEISRSFENEFFDFPKDSIWVLNITGNGFLKQMVRLIVGALLQLGQNKIEISDICDALKAEREFRCGPVAPPNGLYLNQVFF